MHLIVVIIIRRTLFFHGIRHSLFYSENNHRLPLCWLTENNLYVIRGQRRRRRQQLIAHCAHKRKTNDTYFFPPFCILGQGDLYIFLNIHRMGFLILQLCRRIFRYMPEQKKLSFPTNLNIWQSSCIVTKAIFILFYYLNTSSLLLTCFFKVLC